MRTESQAPLLETDTVRGIEAGLFALKVPFPMLMARILGSSVGWTLCGPVLPQVHLCVQLVSGDAIFSGNRFLGNRSK